MMRVCIVSVFLCVASARMQPSSSSTNATTSSNEFDFVNATSTSTELNAYNFLSTSTELNGYNSEMIYVVGNASSTDLDRNQTTSSTTSSSSTESVDIYYDPARGTETMITKIVKIVTEVKPANFSIAIEDVIIA